MSKNLKIRQIHHFLTTALLKNCFVYIFAESGESAVGQFKKNWEDFSSKRCCRILKIQKNLEIHQILPILCIKFFSFQNCQWNAIFWRHFLGKIHGNDVKKKKLWNRSNICCVPKSKNWIVLTYAICISTL